MWVFIKLTMESGRGKRRERHLRRLVSEYLHGACGPCLCGQSNKTHLLKSGGPSLKVLGAGPTWCRTLMIQSFVWNEYPVAVSKGCLIQGKDGCVVCSKLNWKRLGLTQRASWKSTHPQVTLCLCEQPCLVRIVRRLLPWMVCFNRYELWGCSSFSVISSLITQSPGYGLEVIWISADQGALLWNKTAEGASELPRRATLCSSFLEVLQQVKAEVLELF